MKKIFLFPVFLLLLLSSCEKDDSLDPRPVLVAGQYVRLDITRGVLNFDEINTTSFGGLLTTPGGNVSSYNLYVRKTDIFGFAGEFKLLKTITSFPTDLSVTPSEIATALGVPLSSLVYGDIFRFYGESFDSSGNRADFYSLSNTVQSTPSMKQAYRFITTMTNTAGTTDLFDNYTTQ